jgi:hypothetical protein
MNGAGRRVFLIGAHMNRRARDRRIAEEIGTELCEALGGPVPPEALTENRDTVCEVFGRVFDRHGIVTESAGACVLACVPRVLAIKLAERNRRIDAAMRIDRAE